MKALYIPTGPANLMSLFPAIYWPGVVEYYVTIEGSAGVLATSNHYKVSHPCEHQVRIHFLNSLGTIDAVNMQLFEVDNATKSMLWTQPVQSGQSRSQHHIGRIDLTSQRRYAARTVSYGEADLEWLQELADTKLAWIEITGTQGLPDQYIPIVVADGTLVHLKDEGSFEYLTVIEFTLSHPKILHR